jgi:site-specific recombinase XerD
LATTQRSLRPVPPPGTAPTWSQASDQFLRRHLAPSTKRVYRLTLERMGQHFGDARMTIDKITGAKLSAALHTAYPEASPATWNRNVATIRSFVTFCRRHGWLDHDPTTAIERRREPADRSRWLSREDLDRLFASRTARIRDRALWLLLYESAARAEEVLNLNVEDLNLATRQATITGKGGDTDVIHWATRTARLLPKVIDGRTRGPLFLADRPPAASRAPARDDLDPTTGRARLSYRRAAEIFTDATSGATLHQLRHSAISHLAEDNVPLPLLMAKSRHVSLRTLQRYARPSVEAVARLTAEHDPTARRRPRGSR